MDARKAAQYFFRPEGSLFQALGSWGRAKRSEKKKRGRTKALVLPYFFSRLPFFRSQLPRAWNRLSFAATLALASSRRSVETQREKGRAKK